MAQTSEVLNETELKKNETQKYDLGAWPWVLLLG